MLIVEGTRGKDPMESSGLYFQVALAGSSSRYVSADLISDLNLDDKLLSDYRAVALCGVGQVSEREADALQKFVNAGGTLLIFMGEPVLKDKYNSILLPRKLMPGALIKRVDSGDKGSGYNFDFKPTSIPHPFLNEFKNKENTGLENTKVFTYWQADVSGNPSVERVLNYLPVPDAAGKLPAGPPDPAITHHTLGNGHVMFVSTTANPQWTNFQAHMAYLELMNEMLQGGVRTGDYWMNLTVGQPLEIPPEVKSTKAPELKDDANVSIVIDPITDKDPITGREKATIYRSRPITKPGLYSLDLGSGTVPIAVNVPAEEADVRTIGNDEVHKALGDIDMALEGDDIPSDVAADREGSDWAGPALIALFILVGVECFLAMRFGHYRRVIGGPATASGA